MRTIAPKEPLVKITLRTTILLSIFSMSAASLFAAPTGTNPRPQVSDATSVFEAPTGTNPRPQVSNMTSVLTVTAAR